MSSIPGLDEVRAALKEAGQEHVLQVGQHGWGREGGVEIEGLIRRPWL